MKNEEKCIFPNIIADLLLFLQAIENNYNK